MAPQTPAEGFKIGLSVCQLFFLQKAENKDSSLRLNNVVWSECATDVKISDFLFSNVLLSTIKTWMLFLKNLLLSLPVCSCRKGPFHCLGWILVFSTGSEVKQVITGCSPMDLKATETK